MKSKKENKKKQKRNKTKNAKMQKCNGVDFLGFQMKNN